MWGRVSNSEEFVSVGLPASIREPSLWYNAVASTLVLHAETREDGVPLWRVFVRRATESRYCQLGTWGGMDSLMSVAVSGGSAVAVVCVAEIKRSGTSFSSSPARLFAVDLVDLTTRQVPVQGSVVVGSVIGIAADGSAAYGVAHVTRRVEGRDLVVPVVGAFDLATGAFTDLMLLQFGLV